MYATCSECEMSICLRSGHEEATEARTASEHFLRRWSLTRRLARARPARRLSGGKTFGTFWGCFQVERKLLPEMLHLLIMIFGKVDWKIWMVKNWFSQIFPASGGSPLLTVNITVKLHSKAGMTKKTLKKNPTSNTSRRESPALEKVERDEGWAAVEVLEARVGDLW